MTLGGRVSEEIFFGYENITSGAQDDLQKITRLAFEAVANYGMNEVVGPVSYGGARARQDSWQKPFSEKTGQVLDDEVRKMIVYVYQSSLSLMLLTYFLYRTAHERTKQLLTKHKEDVEKVAKLLLEKEVIIR